MKLVLIAGTLLMLFKFYAYYLTNSHGILTDAMESIVNVLSGILALYSLYYAAKPRDEDHPYGHGKIEFMTSGAEGGMIFLTGLAMLINGIAGFFKPFELANLDFGVYLTVFAGGVNYLLGRMLIRKGKKLHSSALVGDGMHLLTDTWSSVGLVLALALIYFTGWNWLDLVTTIVLGLLIAYTGFKLIRESVFNLLDKADLEKMNHLIEFLDKNRKENWIDIHNLRVVKYGSVVHVDCHMTLPWYFSLEEAHKEVDELGKLATRNLNFEVEFFIHADPCLPDSCSICGIKDCKVRKQPLLKKLTWNLGNVLPDAKHSSIPFGPGL
ncbi:MAG TPA: cation diffusion facilitator family transporter [Bacteroidia bacterium]|nr:cation diffusion facilitator family transporter [Bacteroidia bacterium]